MYGMPNHQPQWEYHIEYIYANASKPQAKDFLATYYPGKKFPKYAVQVTKMRPDELGADGWELVQMEPVDRGNNGDIRIGGQEALWTNTYFCVFKRLKRSTY